MTPEVKERIDQFQHGNVPEGYTQTRSGIVPVEWTDACLGDIYTERKESGNEDLPLLMVSIHSGVSDGEVDEDDLPKKVKRIEDKSQYKRAAKGDLVFNMMRAWQGAIGTVRTEGMVSPAYIVAEPNDMVDPLFMDYYMKTNRMVHALYRQSYGVTDFRLRLYWDSFAPIQCVLPSVKEQKKIAEILTTQDKVIELEGRKIEEIKKAKQFFLNKMFPKKGQSVPEIRFKGFTDAWEQHKLGDLVDVCSGRDYKHLSEGDIPVYGTGGYMLSVSEALSYAKDAIGIGRKGTIDKPYILNAPFWTVDTLFYAIPREKIDLSFAFNIFQNIDWKKKDESTGVPSLSKTAINEIDVLVPQYDEQQALGQFFNGIDNLITLHQRKFEEMKKQKKALMQLLLTGIVRV
ncbi:MAG: restriction endonuclease subunit S [Faecousia sp.]